MSNNKVRPPVVTNYDDKYEREIRTAVQRLSELGTKQSLVTNVALTTGTTQVAHRLGVQPTGWIIVDKTAQADVWRDSTVTVTNDLFPLKASANVTVSIQFFVNQRN